MLDKFRDKNKLILLFLGVVGFVLLYLVNRLYPLHPDDWEYMYVYSVNSDATQRISGLVDIIKSQYDHYFLWGGRVIVHAIAHLLLMMDKEWINMINSGVYISFLFLVYHYTKRRGEVNYWLFAYYFFTLWLFVPSFFSVALWVTGSANYLWGNLIVLLFMYPIYRYYRYGYSRNKRLLLILMPLGGLLAGWSNENASAGMLAFVVLVFILLKIEQKQIPMWAMLGFAFALIGFVFMIKAPGNVNRFLLHDRFIEELDITNPKVFNERYKALSFHFHYSWVKHLSWAYGAVLVVFWMLKNNLLDKREKKKVLKLSLLFYVTAAISFLAMLGSPTIPERSIFFPNTLIIMAMGLLISNFDFKLNKLRQTVGLVCIIGLLSLFCRDYYRKYITLEMIDSFWVERAAIVKSELEKGNSDIVFTSTIEVDYKYSVAQELNLKGDPEYWTNKRYARYRGLNSVIVVGDSIYNYKYFGIPQFEK